MFDARELLGQMLQGGMSSSTQNRLGHALGPQGLGAGQSPLSDLLRRFGQGGRAVPVVLPTRPAKCWAAPAARRSRTRSQPVVWARSPARSSAAS